MLKQHDDDTSKGHTYFISEERPLRNKQTDASASNGRRNNNNEPIPAFEVKGYRRIVYCTPSVHKNNRPYQIVGTLTPKFLTNRIWRG